MRKTRLSSSEIQDLINKYQSELKKLEFQTEGIVSTITELQDWLDSVEQSEKSALSKMSKKKRIAPLRSTLPAGVKRKRGRPPRKDKKTSEKAIISEKKQTKKEELKKGYKLSNWDKWVISGITQNGKPQITQEIIDSVKVMTQDAGVKSTEEEIKNKVIRSLQKLANRRGDLIKVPYKGKGYAYAVPGMPGSKRKVGRKLKKK